jgi:hypothetical protein
MFEKVARSTYFLHPVHPSTCMEQYASHRMGFVEFYVGDF